MRILKIGIATPAEYKERTIAIVKGEFKESKDDPKIWFTSIESAAKILSHKNRELLGIISKEKPESVQDLAQLSGRAKSNLSRTLHTMQKYGLIKLEKGKGKAIVPHALYDKISLELPLVA